jgi:hypothetical protein
MPKRKVSKKRVISSKKKQGYTHIYIGLAVMAVGIISLLILINLPYSSAHVLGARTFLARGGDDSSGDSDGGTNSGSGSSGESTTSGESTSGSSGSSNTSGNEASGGGSNESSHTTETINTQHVSGGTTVNCTGPDGKVFQTTISNCENLNKQWNHPVSFTVVNTPKQIAPRPTHIEAENEHVEKTTIKQEDKNNEIEAKHSTERENEQEPLEVESKDQQSKVNLKKNGTVIELRANQGRVELQAKQEDGTQVELGDDSLKTVNDELAKENEFEIEHDSSGALVLKHGLSQAKTTLPISVNLATNELTVTTPKGTKVVALLPDEAVNKLVSFNVIDSVEPEINDTVTLTEVNGTPVFEVKGVDDQKMLGAIPVKIHKIVNISAEDGTVKSTNESLRQKFLDLISF